MFQAVTRVAQAIVIVVDHAVAGAGNTIVGAAQPLIEPLTSSLGRIVAPIADFPLIQFVTAIPGIKWLLAAVGQVNQASIRQDVELLRRQYPSDSNRQLAQRVITTTTKRAALVGLLTNGIPPLALLLILVDLGAVAALQASMIYRIAAIYGYAPEDSDRRGEVLAIWFLSSGIGSAVKSSISVYEIIPGIGTVIGVASDASLLYAVGYLSCRYYETKTTTPDVVV